jgi:hypothetical protein
MIWLALGALLLAGFVMLGRASSRSGQGGDWRVAGGILAIAALVGAAVLAVRGAHLPAAALAFAALTAASLSRRPPPSRPRRREPHKIAMSEAEARAVLGVAPDADAEAVQAAYVRLMRRVHPDTGGAPGLAAQLNAARDRLTS